jgi:hypothetical protein
MMPRSPDDIDNLILEALLQEDVQPLDDQEGQSMAEMLTGVFRGRHRLLAIGGAVVNLALFVFALFCGVKVLGAEELRPLVLWGFAMLLAFGAITAIKIWYWLEMNRLALTREIKRLQLRVSWIARHFKNSGGD